MPRKSWQRARPTWCRWRAASSTIRIGAGTPPRHSAPRWPGLCNMPAPAPSCGRRPPRKPELENFVFIAVLFAALCHAGWNALIKVGLEPLSTTALIVAGATVFTLVAVPFVPLPAAASWPYLVASSFVHLFYFAGLAEAYRTGDLGQVYPIARGSAPLMTATAGTFLVG